MAALKIFFTIILSISTLHNCYGGIWDFVSKGLPPYNRYGGRYGCLLNTSTAPSALTLGYSAVCAEDIPSNNFLEPKIRIRAQFCNAAVCWTETTDLKYNGECIPYGSGYFLPTKRYCARIANPALKVDGEHIAADYGYYGGDWQYAMKKKLLGVKNPVVDLKGRVTESYAYKKYNTNVPKLCVYDDPGILQNPLDFLDYNLHSQPFHTSDRRVNYIAKIVKVAINISVGASDLGISAAGGLSKMVTSLIPWGVGEWLSNNIITPIINILNYIIGIIGFVLDKVIDYLGNVNKIVYSTIGCIDIPLGPKIPDYPKILSVFSVASTKQICPTYPDGYVKYIPQEVGSNATYKAREIPSCNVKNGSNALSSQCISLYNISDNIAMGNLHTEGDVMNRKGYNKSTHSITWDIKGYNNILNAKAIYALYKDSEYKRLSKYDKDVPICDYNKHKDNCMIIWGMKIQPKLAAYKNHVDYAGVVNGGCVFSKVSNNYLHNSVRVGIDIERPLCLVKYGDNKTMQGDCAYVYGISGDNISFSVLQAINNNFDILNRGTLSNDGFGWDIPGYNEVSTKARVIYALYDSSKKEYTKLNNYDPSVRFCGDPDVTSDGICQTIWGINLGQYQDASISYNASSSEGIYKSDIITISDSHGKSYDFILAISDKQIFVDSNLNPNKEGEYVLLPNYIYVFAIRNGLYEQIASYKRPPAPDIAPMACNDYIAGCQNNSYTTPYIVANMSIKQKDPRIAIGNNKWFVNKVIQADNVSSTKSDKTNLLGVEITAFVTDEANAQFPFYGDRVGKIKMLEHNSKNTKNKKDKSYKYISDFSTYFGIYKNNANPIKNKKAYYLHGLEYIGGKYVRGGKYICLNNNISFKSGNKKNEVLTYYQGKKTKQENKAALPSSLLKDRIWPQPSEGAELAGMYYDKYNLAKSNPLPLPQSIIEKFGITKASILKIEENKAADRSSNVKSKSSGNVAIVNYNQDKCTIRPKTSRELGLCVPIADSPKCVPIKASEDTNYASWPEGGAGDKIKGKCKSGYRPKSKESLNRYCTLQISDPDAAIPKFVAEYEPMTSSIGCESKSIMERIEDAMNEIFGTSDAAIRFNYIKGEFNILSQDDDSIKLSGPNNSVITIYKNRLIYEGPALDAAYIPLTIIPSKIGKLSYRYSADKDVENVESIFSMNIINANGSSYEKSLYVEKTYNLLPLISNVAALNMSKAVNININLQMQTKIKQKFSKKLKDAKLNIELNYEAEK